MSKSRTALDFPSGKPTSFIQSKPSAIVLTVIGILSRFIPHPPNLTAVGATSTFGGAKLSRPWNYIVPVFVLFVTDLVIGFHATMPYVYVGFLLYVWVGERFLTNKPSVGKLGAITVVSTLLFFLITNFGAWESTTMYPHTLEGLLAAYVAGIPFLKNMLLGDLVLTVSLFKAYEILETGTFMVWFDKTVRPQVQ